MAEEETNQSPEEDTRTVTHFPEAEGKTVKSIEVYITADHHSVNINFTDNTAVIIPMEPSVTMFPYYGDWTTGERKILKEWKPIKSISLKQ
jgi:hypothetical protein